MGTVRTRKRGKTFSYIFEAGHVNGRRKVIEKGGFPTKEAAYTAGVQAFTDWQHGGIGLTSTRIRLRDFADLWLKNVARLNVRTSSLVSYKARLRRHVYPILGDTYIQDLTPSAIANWMNKQAEDGFSYSTLKTAHGLLKSILNYAVYPGCLINSNPAIYIKVPRNAPRNLVKRTIIPPERMREILTRYPVGHHIRIILLLLYNTGMRIGEVLGLTYPAIDFEHRVIHVKIQFQGPMRPARLAPVKTSSSVRDIPIDSGLLRELEEWRAIQSERRERNGGLYNDVFADQEGILIQQSHALPPPKDAHPVQLVCTQDNGRFMRAAYVWSALHKEGLNAHSFRHTHATLLIEAGAPVKGVSARLGHAKTDITQDLYTHRTEQMAHDTERVFESVLDKK